MSKESGRSIGTRTQEPEVHGTGYILHRFPAIFHKGDTFCDFRFIFLHTKSLLKRIYFKGKNLLRGGKNLLRGSKFFPVKVNPLSRMETDFPPLKIYHFLLNKKKGTKLDIGY